MVHAHREFLQCCDDGSKGKVAEMEEGIQTRFGGGMKISHLSEEEIPWEFRSLEPAMLAHAGAAQRGRTRRARRGKRGG